MGYIIPIIAIYCSHVIPSRQIRQRGLQEGHGTHRGTQQRRSFEHRAGAMRRWPGSVLGKTGKTDETHGKIYGDL